MNSENSVHALLSTVHSKILKIPSWQKVPSLFVPFKTWIPVSRPWLLYKESKGEGGGRAGLAEGVVR